jgi:hypothetical protein
MVIEHITPIVRAAIRDSHDKVLARTRRARSSPRSTGRAVIRSHRPGRRCSYVTMTSMVRSKVSGSMSPIANGLASTDVPPKPAQCASNRANATDRHQLSSFREIDGRQVPTAAMARRIPRTCTSGEKRMVAILRRKLFAGEAPVTQATGLGPVVRICSWANRFRPATAGVDEHHNPRTDGTGFGDIPANPVACAARASGRLFWFLRGGRRANGVRLDRDA